MQSKDREVMNEFKEQSIKQVEQSEEKDKTTLTKAVLRVVN